MAEVTDFDRCPDGCFDQHGVVESDVSAAVASRDAVLVRHLPGLHLERRGPRERAESMWSQSRPARRQPRRAEATRILACSSPSHPLVLRARSALSRSPARAEDVRRLAVDAVRRIHHELAVLLFVDSRGAEVDVESLHLGGKIGPQIEVRGSVVTGVVPGAENAVELGEGQPSVGLHRVRRVWRRRDLRLARIFLDRDAGAERARRASPS